MQRVHIQTFGCQMNAYDTERMRELLVASGWQDVAEPADADLVILNSCAIREKAEQKVTSAAGRFREWKAARPGALLAISGCVATQEGERLLARSPLVDFTFGPDQIAILPSLIDRARASKLRFSATDFIDVEDYTFLDAKPLPGSVAVTALVTIQKGCDHHCAYCVVPATRGAEVSRPAGEVVLEVERLVALGAREVTLVGQNVNAYHAIGTADGDDFAELLGRVDAVPGLRRLRYTTSHPKSFSRAVARAYAELRTLQPWLHLPVQSGSSRTLKRMVREYSREQYLEQIDWVRAACPDIALSTDIIVGYPGETDADFAETISLLEQVRYDSIYSFEYSPRPDTPALKLRLRDDVPAEVKSARLQAVQALQNRVTAVRLERLVGRTVEVLIEGEAARGDGRLCGRAPGNEMVNFDAVVGDAAGEHSAGDGRTRRDELLGAIVDVEITARRAHSLAGRMVGVRELGAVRPARMARARRLPVITDAPTIAAPAIDPEEVRRGP